jgi:hypothetical protein
MLTNPAKYVFTVLLIAAVAAPATVCAAAEADDVERVAAQFFEAFIHADVDKMGQHFADKVLFDGEEQFIGREALDEPAELTKTELSDAYRKLFKKIGRERWSGLLKRVKPTLSEVTEDEKPVRLAKAGDYVYDLHFREAIKGKRRGLDEAILFVFRKVDGKFRIVAHFADY